MCKRFHLEAEDSTFSHLSWSASRTLITPICLISCQFGGSCFSLSAQGTSLFTRCVVSCHVACVPLSCQCLLPDCYNIYVVWLNKSSKLDNYLPWKLKKLSLSHWYYFLCYLCVCVCVIFYVSFCYHMKKLNKRNSFYWIIKCSFIKLLQRQIK